MLSIIVLQTCVIICKRYYPILLLICHANGLATITAPSKSPLVGETLASPAFSFFKILPTGEDLGGAKNATCFLFATQKALSRLMF